MSTSFSESTSVFCRRLPNNSNKSPIKSVPSIPTLQPTGRPYATYSAVTSKSTHTIDSAISSGSSTSSSNASAKNEVDEDKLYDDYLRNRNITAQLSNYDLSYYFHETPPHQQQQQEQINFTAMKQLSNYKEDDDTIENSSSLIFRARSLSIDSTFSSQFINNATSAHTSAAFHEYNDVNSLHNDGGGIDTMPFTSSKVLQQKYRKKTDKSNKKALQFFGEQVKLEISAKEIRREGLKALLFSTVPLGYFLYHLLNEYSSENLFFFLAVENYQNYNFTSDLERQQVANKIAKAYLTRNADLEVNLEDKIYREVERSLQEQQRRPSLSTANEFDAAKRHVFTLLNVSYHRFRTSSIWDVMESKCSDVNSFNKSRSQALVVNLLLTYIERNNGSSLHKLVHSFCKIYLPSGYESREPSATTNEKDINYDNYVHYVAPLGIRRNRSKSFGGGDVKKGNRFTSKLDKIFLKNHNKSR